MVDLYVNKVKRLFGDRIVCLLYYGSRAYASRTVTVTSDYDFCLVLDTPELGDLEKLRQLSLTHSSADTTFYYLSELEKRGWHNFQLGNHGAFSLLYLATAKSIIGTNIFFLKSSMVDNAKVQRSLRYQIMEYLWRIDHWILTVEPEEELIRKMQKYLVRITHDMEVMQGDLSFDEINVYSNAHYLDHHIQDKDYFSDETKELFEGFYENPTLQDLISLKESLKNDFLELEQRSMVAA